MKNLYTHKHVLVTGGAGFIGSHTVEKLVSLGAYVTVLDDLSSGTLENLETVKNNITFINGSITDYQTCVKACKNQNYIIHLAALVSVPESVEKPLLCHEINVTGTVNMLEAAYAQNVSAFLLASSSAVYGPLAVKAQEDMLCAPVSPYGLSKYIGELYAKQYANIYGLKTVITRYFNVFGPRQSTTGSYAGVIAQFRDKMFHNIPITIFGDGSQARDFIHVKDVVEANLFLTAHVQNTPELLGQSFNIGSGQTMSVRQLFYTIKTEFSTYTHEPIFADQRAGDIAFSQANISKYKKFLQAVHNK